MREHLQRSHPEVQPQLWKIWERGKTAIYFVPVALAFIVVN